jgi:hypothetical protein
MKRRNFLGSALAGATVIAAPRIVRPEARKAITFVPHADLASLDPVWTTADVNRNFALAVYDTLYGYDADFNAQPQMVEGHTIENGGLQWDLSLRQGLKFHDGSPVLARDCVATVMRWAKRYPMGEALMTRTDEIFAISDKTIRFRLNKPFPVLPEALAEPYCSIMSERLAKTDHGGGRFGSLQIRGLRADAWPAHRFRQKPGLRPAGKRQAELQRWPEGGACRAGGLECRAGSGNRRRGAFSGRDRLVGEPDDRLGAAPPAQ